MHKDRHGPSKFGPSKMDSRIHEFDGTPPPRPLAITQALAACRSSFLRVKWVSRSHRFSETAYRGRSTREQRGSL